MNAYRILMFRGGALGDFFLTLPAIRALRNAWPRVFIELVGRPEIAEPALVSGLIDNIVSIDSARIASYFVPHAELPSGETAYIQSFDVIISCVHDPDGVVRSNLIQAGARHVLSIAPQVKSGHAIDHWIKPLSELGVYGNGREMAQLDLPTQYRAMGKRRLGQTGLKGNVIAFHPGSGSPKKNWPLPRFIALAGKILHEGIGQPVFLVGEADEAIAEALRRAGLPTLDERARQPAPKVRGPPAKAGQAPSLPRVSAGPRVHFPVLGGCSLLELASVLSACTGYVGNDSGITHLAAALGVRTVALFGPTDAAVWAPRGPHVSIVASRGQGRKKMESIRVNEVFERLRNTRASHIPCQKRSRICPELT